MNQVTNYKNYFVSYANTSGSGVFRGNTPTETALCKDGNYFILNGDHRKAYAKLKNFTQCKKYFKSKPELISSWSN